MGSLGVAVKQNKTETLKHGFTRGIINIICLSFVCLFAKLPWPGDS